MYTYRYRCHGHIGMVGWKVGAHCYLILFSFYYRDKQKAIKKYTIYIFRKLINIQELKNYTKLKSKLGSRYTNTIELLFTRTGYTYGESEFCFNNL